jgi:hypothetical protein
VTDNPDLWVVRELRTSDDPALELTQSKDRVRVELAHVKGVVAALVGAAADRAEVLASGAEGYDA